MRRNFYFYWILISFLPVFVFAHSNSDTLTTASGLKYIILERGSGEPVGEGMEVTVNYTGRFLDGRVFDSSYGRNEPILVILGTGSVIKGWEEALLLMSVGDKFRFIIPPELAYGEKGAGNVIPPNSTLVFDIEVLSQSDPRISTADALYITLNESGLDSALAKYYDLKEKFPTIFDFREKELLHLGYKLYKEKKLKASEAFLLLNLDEYPESINTMSGLSEVYRAAKQHDKETEILNRLLKIDPQNEGAIKRLAELESEK